MHMDEACQAVVLWYFRNVGLSVQSHFKINFNSLGWLASNLALQYYPWTKHEGHERKENDRQLQKLLTVRQSLLVNTFGNV